MFDLHAYHSDVISFAELEDPSDVWELGETIGEGTYGAVYLGTHKVTGERVKVVVNSYKELMACVSLGRM